MNNFFIKKFKNEDGAVLITSLLFLMVVTVLSVIGMQSPRTDILISSNEKLHMQSQQLANLGVMEAKNWLEVHYTSKSVPVNVAGIDPDTNNLIYFVVARPTPKNTFDLSKDVDTNFSRAGVLRKTPITITIPSVSDPSTYNTPDTGAESDVVVYSSATSNSNTLTDAIGNTIGTYGWNIVRMTKNPRPGSVEEIGTNDIVTYTEGLGEGIVKEFSKTKIVSQSEEGGIGDGTVNRSFFHISSKADVNSLIANAEAITSYKSIVPSTD